MCIFGKNVYIYVYMYLYTCIHTCIYTPIYSYVNIYTYIHNTYAYIGQITGGVGVNFQILEGDRVLVSGPSGCGKSSFLRYLYLNY
jgi:ABC-type polysaccharide/polyol phosphate transport system ATPase subunit